MTFNARNTNDDEMWTSKLGTRYPKKDVEANHESTMSLLRKLRSEPSNRVCADCGKDGTMWASVNLGVFTCLRCGSLHRALGTHVSKPKGCTGTYLWGPDEIQRMREIGNERALALYGGTASQRPDDDAPDGVWLSYLRDKYERRLFVVALDSASVTATTVGEGAAAGDCATPSRSAKPGEVASVARGVASAQKKTQLPGVRTADLLCLDSMAGAGTESRPNHGEDFFSQFGL